MLYLQSLDKAKKATPEEVMKVLTDLKNFKGVTGNISFDKSGDPVKSAVILRVEKDGFKYVTTVNP
jgi:branched-chain amino acid transport system substrate-binding protein